MKDMTPLFGAIDYAVCGVAVSLSLAIGLYFGFWGRGSNNVDEYLHGGRRLKTLPVAISLIASQISSIALISHPSEIYSYGTQHSLIAPVMIIVSLTVAYIFLPVFFKTGVTNVYKYLELRFDCRVRRLTSFLYILMTIAFSPIISYVPALAFSQVSGINVHLINASVCSICILYTTLGGIKAVVWTDVVQGSILFLSSLLTVVIGLINIGGLGVVFQRANAGGRIEFFNMDPSLTARLTFWSASFGRFVWWLSYVGLNQTSVQRLVSVPSIGHAKRVLIIFGIGTMLIMLLSSLTGILMYATYHKCDPVKSKIIGKADNILPFYIMDTIGHLNGMSGIFIAAIFSASLSTLSAQFNSLSGVIYQDYVRKWNMFSHTEARANLFMKITVVTSGIYCMLGGFVVDNFAQILQMVLTVTSTTTGVTAGIFTLGMLTPWGNRTGTFYGSIISLVVLVWITIGGQIALKNGDISYPPLPTSIEDCAFLNESISNITLQERNISSADSKEIFFLYKLSYNYYCLFAFFIVWIVGLVISFLTSSSESKDTSLFASCIHCVLPRGEQTSAVEENEHNDLDNEPVISFNNKHKYIPLKKV